jgi:hypothetical protein
VPRRAAATVATDVKCILGRKRIVWILEHG